MDKRIQFTENCRFCGQNMTVEVEEGMDIREYVTMHCNCSAGDGYRKRAKRKKRALDAVEALFGPLVSEQRAQDEDVVAAMYNAVELILNYKINKMTIKISENVKAVISLTSKDEVKVERVDTDKKYMVE